MLSTNVQVKPLGREFDTEFGFGVNVPLKATPGQQETPDSHMVQQFCSLEKWLCSEKRWYVLLFNPSACEDQEKSADVQITDLIFES